MFSQKSQKKLKLSYTANHQHWVGSGFYVNGLIRPTEDLNPYISPFILMDYAAPKYFSKTNKRRGVGEHPHRGFETVTLCYKGEIEHRDSAGGGGTISPGDVQWMTAGSGIVHDEFHSKQFAKEGGTFEMVQLWVNLPKAYKLTAPKYQSIQKSDIPVLQLSDRTKLSIIAGEYNKTNGPASTFSPINMFKISGTAPDELTILLKNNTNTILFVLDGSAHIDGKDYPKKSILIFEQDGETIQLKTSNNFNALLLNGAPINEPIFTHGPFVMNTREEILTAIEDYKNGKMGTLPKS